jgi:hypothetical protein
MTNDELGNRYAQSIMQLYKYSSNRRALPVMPAEAGHPEASGKADKQILDSRLRGNDKD